MRKIVIASIAVVAALALVGVFMKGSLNSPVEAGSKNATYMEWFWNNPATPGGGSKSAYFMRTGSGIVHAWAYDHPDIGDARMIWKPLSKFGNAVECDEGWVRENTNWNPQNLNNAMYSQYKTMYWDYFDMGEMYLFCAYPME